jgi:hypothetical protein
MKRSQIALLGGVGGIVGAFVVFLPLAIAFLSGEFLTEWADTSSPIPLTEDTLRLIWGLFLGLVYGIPFALILSALQKKGFWKDPGKWCRELPASKRQTLSYFAIGLVGGIPGWLMGAKMGLRPGESTAGVLTALLLGLLIGFIGGFSIACWSSYGPKYRVIGILAAIAISAELADCTIVGIIAIIVVVSLLWPSNNRQVNTEQEAPGDSTPTGGDSVYRRS